MNKILIVCDEYVYYYNGEFYLRSFGHVLLQRYLKVFDSVRFVARTKVVNSENDLGDHHLVINDLNVEIFPISFFQGPKEYLKKFVDIKRQINCCSYDCNGAVLRIPSTLAFACLKVINKHKIPFIVEVVASPIDLFKSAKSLHIKILFWIMHLNQIKACRQASGASYVTEKALQKIYPISKKYSFESYYSSVHLPESFFSNPRLYPANASPFIICHISNPIKSHNKGHLTFIRVINELNKRGYNVVGKVAGEGILVPFLKNESENLGLVDRIQFLGLLDRIELRELLISSHLMLFPTLSEGVPRVVIEAMATGLPCLSSPVGGIPEILDADMLLNPQDIEGFTSKIIEIINNSVKYEVISKSVYEKSKEFSSDILDNRRIAFYSKFKSQIRINDNVICK